jgi:hypothetical protein
MYSYDWIWEIILSWFKLEQKYMRGNNWKKQNKIGFQHLLGGPTMDSGEMHIPLLYIGRLSQSNALGQDTLYCLSTGSHPVRAFTHTPLHGGITSWRKLIGHIGANMAHRKKSRSSLHLVSTSGWYCSMTSCAFLWALWNNKFGILVRLYGNRWHIGMRIGSQMAP